MNDKKPRINLEQVNVAANRLKFDPVALTPRPFEGISIIHNINSSLAGILGLPKIASDLQSQFARVGLNTQIAFVSRDSFHITTFNLINEPEDSGKLHGQTYQHVRDCVEQAAKDFLRNYTLRAAATVSEVGMFPSGVLKLEVALSVSDKLRFKEFRLELYEHLKRQIEMNYSPVRGKEWSGGHSHHITLGYIVNPMNAEEASLFSDTMERFKFVRVDLELTQGEVTGFRNMNEFFRA